MVSPDHYVLVKQLLTFDYFPDSKPIHTQREKVAWVYNMPKDHLQRTTQNLCHCALAGFAL